MEKIQIKELAKYCNSININCSICEKKDACDSFTNIMEDLSPIGVVGFVNSNEEIIYGY